jgi:adenylylsulfate kinase-like enzyme
MYVPGADSARRPLSCLATMPNMRDDGSVLLLTGTVGTGKTTIGAEIATILAERGSPIVVVDLDQLGMAFIPDGDGEIRRLRIQNLSAIWPNLRSAGFSRVVLSATVAAADELDPIRDAVTPAIVTVVRLRTPPSVREARLNRRDSGHRLEHHLTIMPGIERTLDETRIEDHSVENEGRSPPRCREHRPGSGGVALSRPPAVDARMAERPVAR